MQCTIHNATPCVQNLKITLQLLWHKSEVITKYWDSVFPKLAFFFLN